MSSVIPLFGDNEPVADDTLRSFDWIVVNSSAGKDSQAALDVVVERTKRAGVRRSKIVVFHADLGRVEWPGTPELAAEHAAHYGLRFEKIGRPQGDLLTHIEERGMWPDAARRYCTSDHKRAQGRKLLTQLAAETRSSRARCWAGTCPAPTTPVRILNVMGFRRQESPARAKKQAFKLDEAASNKTRRTVYEWCPILEWDADQVWERIRHAGTRHHPAYDLGMPRLSCCLCVLASRSALVIGARANPGLVNEYVRIERKIGHRFRQDLSIEEIANEARASEPPTTVEDWVA